MPSADLPAPAAEGSLAKTPFAHVLLHLLQKELSGTLVVWPEQDGAEQRGQDGVRFEEGRPVAARLRAPASSLGIGLLPFFTRVNAPFAFYEKDLVGSGEGVLEGQMDPVALIAASLRGSAREDVIDAVNARFGDSKLRLRSGFDLARYGFEPKEQAFVNLLRAAPASLAQLAQEFGDERMARRMIYLFAISKAIEPFSGLTPRKVSRPRIPKPSRPRVDAPPRSSGDKQSWTRIPKPAPRVEITDSNAPESDRTASPERDSKPAADSKPRATRGAAPPPGSPRAGRPRSPHAAPEPPPDPPPGLSPEHLARWEEIARKARGIEEKNYFQMLSVNTDASTADIQSAYLGLVKIWHPDRLPPELDRLRPWVDMIFGHLTKAKDTLVETESRVTYLRAVQSGGGTPASDRQVDAIVTAAMQFQKSEVLVRRREWDRAISLLEEAIELNPEDADCHALMGWILFMKHGREAAPWQDIHAALDRALAQNARCERAHLFKAKVLKAQSKPQQAIEHFKKLVEINPKNTEGLREVRLATMRDQKGGKDDGLLSKLFGGGKKK